MATFMQRLREGIQYVFQGKVSIASLAPMWSYNQPEKAIGANYEILVKEGYRKNELIFACLNATAAAASQIQLEIYNKRTDKKVEKHPLLDMIGRPNERMNESDFWAATVIMQKLAGRAFYEIEYNNRGEPLNLWALRPDRMSIEQDPNRPTIRRYVYKVPGMQDQFMDPRQVLDFPLFDPLDRFKTYPPVAVAARVGGVDNAATDHIQMIWEHGGIPQVYIKTTSVLTNKDQVTEIRERFMERYGGHRNWLAPAVMGKDESIEKLAWTFDEMGFEMLDARNEVRICMVLDVPVILIGAKAGLDASTYSNYELADRAWWRNDLLPMFNNLIDVVEYQLLPLYDTSGELGCRWDVSGVYALQEDVDKLWMRVTEALKAGGLTLNEFYQALGMQDLGSAGDVRFLSMATIVVPGKQPMMAMQDTGGTVESSTDDSADDEPKGIKALKAANNAPDDDERRRHERVIDKAMQAYFNEQLDRVVEEAGSNGR